MINIVHPAQSNVAMGIIDTGTLRTVANFCPFATAAIDLLLMVDILLTHIHFVSNTKSH
jgi:hypothetical protein